MYWQNTEMVAVLDTGHTDPFLALADLAWELSQRQADQDQASAGHCLSMSVVQLEFVVGSNYFVVDLKAVAAAAVDLSLVEGWLCFF